MKKYVRINGYRIAYKGDWRQEDSYYVKKCLAEGVIAGSLLRGGWWIISRYSHKTK